MTERSRRRPSLVARIRRVGCIVVACAQTKGGAGKSTVVWNLAHEYAQRGARVLVIDTDTQMTLADTATVRRLAGWPEVVALMAYPHASLWQDFDALSGGYDVVVIDGQGRNDLITRAVVTTAVRRRRGSVVLVPVRATPPDVWATKREMAPILAAARELVTWGPHVRTVLTQYDPREQITQAAIDLLADAPVIAPPTRADIQRRTTYAKSLADGRAVCEFEPGGPAAAEIATLATEAAELALTEPTD
jgi:chromosome partitioning protein